MHDLAVQRRFQGSWRVHACIGLGRNKWHFPGFNVTYTPARYVPLGPNTARLTSVLLPHVVYYYPVLYISTPCCILLPCAVYNYPMQYIITLCCILLHHAVYYYPVLCITNPCCILLTCALYYYPLLCIITLAVCYFLVLYIMTSLGVRSWFWTTSVKSSCKKHVLRTLRPCRADIWWEIKQDGLPKLNNFMYWELHTLKVLNWISKKCRYLKIYSQVWVETKVTC